MLVPRCKGLRIARIVETSNAESPTPMSIYFTLQDHGGLHQRPMRAVYKHPKGRPRCFVFDNPFEVAKFLQRQNQSVQLRLFICMCHACIPPKGLSANMTVQIYAFLQKQGNILQKMLSFPFVY